VNREELVELTASALMAKQEELDEVFSDVHVHDDLWARDMARAIVDSVLPRARYEAWCEGFTAGAGRPAFPPDSPYYEDVYGHPGQPWVSWVVPAVTGEHHIWERRGSTDE
jgi:hypothetical protein